MDPNTQGLSHVEGEHAALYSAIYSLSLGHNVIPPTSTFPPISSNPDTPSPNSSPNTVLHHLNATPAQTSPFPYQPDSIQGNITNSDMGRGEEHFLTNGLLHESPYSSDTTESESLTATMFNLESLNEGCPDWTRGHAVLMDNQSHHSSDSYINFLVRNTDRAGFNIEDGSPSEGPQIRRAQSEDNTVQEAHYTYGSRLVRAQSLDTGLENTGNSRVLSRKRLGMEIGSVGRNIRQKLPCCCLDNEG